MRNCLRLAFCILLTLATAGTLLAQDVDHRPVMADALRADGKIYVVVAVVVTIVIGIFLYLIRLERKIARLEKEA
jgi:CcmD family protein